MVEYTHSADWRVTIRAVTISPVVTQGARPLYALALTGAALVCVGVLAESGPSSEPAYAPMGAALIVGALLTARARPGEALSSFLVVPAVVAYVRFGAATLPALVYASLVANAVHGVRANALIVAAVLDGIAFADAHLLARGLAVQPWLAGGAFGVSFVLLRVGLRYLTANAGFPLPRDRRAERPAVLIPLALAPLGVLPLLTGARLGDGALLLTLAALLFVLVLVHEAAHLAAARAESETERDRLARANAFQDELMSLITHDIKNPLTTVRIYTQLGQRSLKNGSLHQLPEYLAGIAQAGRTLERLADNLLQISRLEQTGALPGAENLQVAEIAHEVVAELEPLAEQKQQTLIVDAPNDLPCISAPPLLLREALSNLLSNAVKYTPPGGRVVVSVQRGEEPNSVQFAVADTGVGLSEADLARLYTKFFRSSDPRVAKERGTGLGLALTQAIVHRMGGQLSAVSELNHGTTFRVVLPISEGGASGDVVAAGHRTAPSTA
jgi:signal transduction histidine kinase